MICSIRFVVCLLTAGAGLLNFSFAQTPQITSTGKRISILNNKYSFLFPPNAKLSPRVADIMAADPNINRETRVIMDDQKLRLVFFAQELYATTNAGMFQEISKEEEPEYGFSRRIIFDKDSLLAVLSTPSKFDTTSGAILVNSLIVKSPDNTVSRVDAYINNEAFPALQNYISLTDSVFGSLQKENRRISLAAKEETWLIPGTTSQLNFKLSPGYFLTIDEKYDFVVYKIKKYKTSLTDTNYAAISLYAGHYPSFTHKEYGYQTEKAAKAKGLFLQSPVEWLSFIDTPQSFFLKEQFIPADMVQKDLKFHVAMLANKKELLDELTGIIESVKLVK